MTSLQKTLREELRKTPQIFLERLLRSKLSDAGIEPKATVVSKLAAKLISGEGVSIELEDDSGDGEVTISLTDEDIGEFHDDVDDFLENKLPSVIEQVSKQSAKSLVAQLKKDWPEQRSWQQTTVLGFQHRLEQRWGEAFDLFGMLLTVSIELGEQAHRRRMRSRAKTGQLRLDLLVRLHARACQVAAEIKALMEAGFADGAIARWRTLHEIGVVCALIEDNGDELAERYLAYEVVESKRVIDMYLSTHKELGYRPPSKRDLKRINRMFVALKDRYGPDFTKRNGWATELVGIKEPSFAQLAAVAQQARMRSHYKMASQNVHAGVKGITDQLGLLPTADAILAGPSNAGIEEPGQNAAITLMQITFTLFRKRPMLDDLVTMRTLMMLSSQAIDAFTRAARRLRRDDAKLRSDKKSQAPSAKTKRRSAK